MLIANPYVERTGRARVVSVPDSSPPDYVTVVSDVAQDGGTASNAFDRTRMKRIPMTGRGNP